MVVPEKENFVVVVEKEDHWILDFGCLKMKMSSHCPQ
jgi:hypothetical protein